MASKPAAAAAAPPAPRAKPAADAPAGAVGQERLSFVAKALLGYTVEVTAKSGALYRGVFAGATLEPKNFGVTLRYVTVTPPKAAGGGAEAPPAARPQPSLVISAKDFAHLRVTGAALSEASLGAATDGDGFATDAAIGARRSGRAGRDLVAWQPDEGDTPVLMGLQEGHAPAGRGRGGGGGGGGGGSGSAGWDQFAANRAQFGVVSTFDENIYTTRLDKSKAGISEAEAARLAREIEGQGSTNFHTAEERGQVIGADDDDEEARFSAVLRGGGGGGGGGADVDAANDDTFGEHTPKSLDDAPPPPARAAAPAAAAPAADAAAGGTAAATATPKKLTLNPNAKPFTFSPSAKAFVPSGAAAAAAAGTAAGGAAAAAAAAAMSAAVAGGAYGYPPNGPMAPRGPMGAAGGWPRGAPYMGMPGGMPMAQMGPGGYPGMQMGMMQVPMGMMQVPMGYAPPQGWRGPGGMMMMPGMPPMGMPQQPPPQQPQQPQPPPQQQAPPQQQGAEAPAGEGSRA